MCSMWRVLRKKSIADIDYAQKTKTLLNDGLSFTLTLVLCRCHGFNHQQGGHYLELIVYIFCTSYCHSQAQEISSEPVVYLSKEK